MSCKVRAGNEAPLTPTAGVHPQRPPAPENTESRHRQPHAAHTSTVPAVFTPTVQLWLHPAPACLTAFITAAVNSSPGPDLPPQPCLQRGETQHKEALWALVRGRSQVYCGSSVPANWRQEIRISTSSCRAWDHDVPSENAFYSVPQRDLLSVGTVPGLSLLLSFTQMPLTLP